jgi:hypothetical protein
MRICTGHCNSSSSNSSSSRISIGPGVVRQDPTQQYIPVLFWRCIPRLHHVATQVFPAEGAIDRCEPFRERGGGVVAGVSRTSWPGRPDVFLSYTLSAPNVLKLVLCVDAPCNIIMKRLLAGPNREMLEKCFLFVFGECNKRPR